MKRRAFRITICLILGVVTTVAVAWACALPAGPWITNVPPGFWYGPQSTWYVRSHNTTGLSRILFVPNASSYPKESAPIESRVPDDTLPAHVLQRMHDAEVEPREALTFWRAGWPLPALRCVEFTWRRTVHDMRLRAAVTAEPALAENAIVLFADSGPTSRLDSERRHLPLRPVFPGFVLDTMFYFAIWFGLFFAAGRTRRFIRRKRGRCPKCGYHLRGDFTNGCSECGWAREGGDD